MAPVPDLSMPFNVLSLTCTLYAFIIGSLINLVLRKASERVKYTLHPDLKPKSKLQLLKERAKSSRFAARLLGGRKKGSSDGSTATSITTSGAICGSPNEKGEKVMEAKPTTNTTSSSND
jgi:hypothetical protein